MTHPFINNYAYNTQLKAESALPKRALPKTRVGILGGGTAGATIAIRLAALGIKRRPNWCVVRWLFNAT